MSLARCFCRYRVVIVSLSSRCSASVSMILIVDIYLGAPSIKSDDAALTAASKVALLKCA